MRRIDEERKLDLKRDEDGDLAFECDDEGYNMVKCLTKKENPPPPISTDPHNSVSKKMDGGKSKKRHGKKKHKKRQTKKLRKRKLKSIRKIRKKEQENINKYFK